MQGVVRRFSVEVRALIPALFMTCVSVTYICIAPEGFRLLYMVSYAIGGLAVLVAIVWFAVWMRGWKLRQRQ